MYSDTQVSIIILITQLVSFSVMFWFVIATIKKQIKPIVDCMQQVSTVEVEHLKLLTLEIERLNKIISFLKFDSDK
jgi:hypothetical protein